MHEKQMHEDSSFVTLTYANVPEGGSLVKRDLQLFMKRLRKARGRVRFFACGEYGEGTYRPHYHLLLFGLDWPDKRFYKNAKAGQPLYNSDALDRIWGLGHCVVGSVDFDSCAYVSRYILEKRNGPQAAVWYCWTDADGVVHERVPEFVVMSRRPGVGSLWFDKFGSRAFELDSVIMNGHEMKPPRFYEKKFELVDPGSLEALKAKRVRFAKTLAADNTPERRRVKDEVQRRNLAMWKRDLS